MTADKKTTLIDDLTNIVGRHADWLDGRTFQQACMTVAEGYFEDEDLDGPLLTQDMLEQILQAFTDELSSGDAMEM